MELKEFIVRTVSDIAEAVRELNEKHSQEGLLVNPMLDSPSEAMNYINDGRCTQNIDFDLMVSTSEKEDAEGHAGIQVVKAGLMKSSSSEETSRIRFSLSVALPTPEHC